MRSPYSFITQVSLLTIPVSVSILGGIAKIWVVLLDSAMLGTIDVAVFILLYKFNDRDLKFSFTK